MRTRTRTLLACSETLNRGGVSLRLDQGEAVLTEAVPAVNDQSACLIQTWTHGDRPRRLDHHRV